MARTGFGAPAWRGVFGITLARAATLAPAGPREAAGPAAGPAAGIVAARSATSPRERAATPPAPLHRQARPDRGRAAQRHAEAPPPSPAAEDGQAVMTRAFFVCSVDCPTFLPAGNGPRQKAVARRT